MAFRSVGTIGIVVGGVLSSTPVLAVAVDNSAGGSAAAAQANRSDANRLDKGAPEYSFTGNGFNFSISRNPAPATADEPSRAAGGTQPSRPGRPSWLGWLQRTIDSLFGD